MGKDGWCQLYKDQISGGKKKGRESCFTSFQHGPDIAVVNYLTPSRDSQRQHAGQPVKTAQSDRAIGC